MQASLFAPAATFENQTLRQIVHISLGGDAVRVKFSNVIGAVPLTINAATVGIRASGANLERGTLRHPSFDVLVQNGAAWVILLEGINDIGFSQIAPGTFPPGVFLTNVSAEEIIAGYQQIIRRVHAQGMRIYGATLTPFVGASYQDAAA
jgi:lysophospholipase L1-like esterase